MTKNILVTGGAGFIGSNFIHHILATYPQYRITVLDAFTYAGSIENLPPDAQDAGSDRVRVWCGSVCNSDLVQTLMADADMVVHFAAETHVTRSIFDNLTFFQTDVLGTQAIANAVVKYAHRIERFIHVSTSEVYGTAETPAMDEDHPLNPASPYASAKCGADRLVYSYWRTYGIPAVIVRPFNNFGPRQHLEKAIPRFITSVLLGEDLTVHGDGSAARDFVHVEDTCRAIAALITAPADKVVGEVFNIATGTDRTILGIAQTIAQTMGYDADRISFVGERPAQVERHTGDWSKIEGRLGWKPLVVWDSGLASTIDWFRQNRPWWEKQVWLRRVPITTRSGRIEYH
ncbi:dTDP-glucose 4,6-dehydratase [Magnetospirillum sp. SS-4]|uniref:dTDP-glucose 4,6-dehydratase n=1 Tax=Magnetospirillum sp. SS-4 TaxID=2681465 RepID=UPI00137FAE8A|nr:GDP-mannose 4,6-dehydratase [Magnetospirillum sp. SS-4]CAA7619621.1 dTDP-glucose 4,6-dehydratase [Magnetospirillum sp. SS-4]